MNDSGQRFRCHDCGAFWPVHYSVCPSCARAGYIIPYAPRPRAIVDSIPSRDRALRARSEHHRRVTREEWGGAQAVFAALDSDGDGKITPEEMAAGLGGAFLLRST